MEIGILSDSHDHMGNIRKAVDFFNRAGVAHVIHCGDYVAPFAAQVLMGLAMPLTGIFGNNDGERAGLQRAVDRRLFEDPHTLEIGGRSIYITHHLSDRSPCEKVDLVACGHSHRPKIERGGRCLIVNPGELCGYLTGEATLALVHLETMAAEIVILE